MMAEGILDTILSGTMDGAGEAILERDIDAMCPNL
jgi:hypothetical protein